MDLIGSIAAVLILTAVAIGTMILLFDDGGDA